MNQRANNLFIYTFYRFKEIKDKKKAKLYLDNYFKKKFLRGTVLLASEGVNASLSGNKKELDESLKTIKAYLKIKKIELKINKIDFLPFNKLRVRLKKEIVSLGKGKFENSKFKGSFIEPEKWNNFVSRKDIKLIDTRNIYEIGIGKFKNSINPQTNTFREFPSKLSNLGITKKDKLAIYCTGGIRCEKASAYLKQNGYQNVSQLKGGILNYLDYFNKNKKNINKSLWEGECFVFDERVTINNSLQKGKYIQCHGCRHPITNEDIQLESYKKGVSCKYCHKKRSLKQIKKSEARQLQINLAEKRGENHTFTKIYTKNTKNN